MGNHKERTGKTRVGKFLIGVKNVAPSVLELASTITGVKDLDKLADAIRGDSEMSTQDKDTALQFLEIDIAEMKEVTKRWESDMVSDSWLSKNVRPLCLISLTVFLFFMIFTDSKTEWNFEIKESYITLMQALLVAVYLAYFGSRGYEKGMKLRNKRK